MWWETLVLCLPTFLRIRNKYTWQLQCFGNCVLIVDLFPVQSILTNDKSIDIVIKKLFWKYQRNDDNTWKLLWNKNDCYYCYENIKTDCFPNKFHFVFSLNTHPKNVFTSTSQLLRNVAATREKKRDANRPSPPSYDPDLAVWGVWVYSMSLFIISSS